MCAYSVILTSIMPRFRKKKPSSSTTPKNNPSPAPVPPIVGNTKQELASSYLMTKNRSVLAASSSTITPPAPSPSSDPTDPAPNEPGSSKESGWRTAYRAAKLAVDIANASSDMFLPLKAVVGALSVLLQNYDVSTPKLIVPSTAENFVQQHIANAGQFRDIEKRVQSLSRVLTSPVDDQDSDEKARREALKRFVFPP